MEYYGEKDKKNNSKLDKDKVLDSFLMLSEAGHLVCRFLVCSYKQSTVCGYLCLLGLAEPGANQVSS